MTRRCPWKKRRPAATPAPPPREDTFVRGEHEFRIKCYSKARDTHYSALSGAFHVGGHTWALDCRFDEEYGHLASVSLELLTAYIAEDSVVAKAGLRIEDPLGRWPAAEWQSDEAHTFPVWSGGDWYEFQSSGRSWELSVPDAFREQWSRYVQDDRLTILCTVEVRHEEEKVSAIAEDIHKLLFLSSEPEPEFQSEKRRRAAMMPDVTFVVEETEIQAHRVVLGMRSPVFAAELLGNMRESTSSRVRVEDMRASTFRAMIRFIYTDKLPIKAAKTTIVVDPSKSKRACKKAENKCAARRRVAMACDLLVAADRYDLEKLRRMCENILSESMDVHSVMPMLIVVQGRQSCRRLEASCIKYLASDEDLYASVKATDEYKELEEDSCYSLLVEVMNKVAKKKKKKRTAKQKRKHNLVIESSSCGGSQATTNSRRRRPTNKMNVSTYNTWEVVRGTLEWRIPNFSSVKRSDVVDRKIHSDTFQMDDGYDWKLFLHTPKEYSAPTETLKEGKIWVSASLLTDPGIAGARVSACFRMVDPSGNSAPTTCTIQGIFTRDVLGWGAREDFTTGEYVESHYLAHDGSLTIHCDIKVTGKSCGATTSNTTSGGGVRAGTTTTIAAPPTHTIASHLKQLLMNRKGSDLTFLVEQREIRAHRMVLATRSPFLYEWMIGVARNKVVVPVSGMKAAVFEAMLHFIYTGELPPMEEVVAEGEDVLMSFVGDLLNAAYWFHLPSMKDKCETFLADSITIQNAESTLKLARQHYCIKLKDYCVDFISSPYMENYIPRSKLDRI